MPRTPFTIHVPDETLADLRDRLGRVGWPDAVDGGGWGYGTDLDYLKGLVAYWRNDFDWRAQEAALNRFPQERVEVDGLGVHLIHQPAVGPAPNPVPLVLLHGWPDSIVRFHKLIPLLADPGAHGGDPADAVTVIAPSIPGYGFSDPPPDATWTPVEIGELLAKVVVDELGYERFAAHGGDVGSSLAESMATARPEAVTGLHITDVSFYHYLTGKPDDPTDAEQAYFDAGEAWGMTEGAYNMIQATKPQTLAYGLTDSPAGLAAWIVEKFRAWSDGDGDIERAFTKDELLTNITLYWATGTIGSSFSSYYGGSQAWGGEDEEGGDDGGWGGEGSEAGGGSTRLDVPVGFASFPKDILDTPRDWAERFFDVRRFTKMPRGGHFAALEEPELLADDIRDFLRSLRQPDSSS